ncbi:MAG: peptidylprolyl isomerase [Nocardiopsaceae bacterium]|nr:peptidylprolyl isomerase [Nocardiopsaceae bacterium]
MPGNKERQRKRARERYERRRAERQERQRKIRRWTGIGLVILAVIGIAAGLTAVFAGGSTGKSHASPSKSGSASPSASPTASAASVTEPAKHCTYTKSGTASKPVSLPPATPDYKATYTATINTNLGPIGIKLLNSKATCAVNSFAHLADANFWNNSQCHRLSDSSGLYMLQCGDPTAKASQTLSCSSSSLGSGGPGYTFADENLKGATYPAGTVAMANSGKNTNGSQFFLVFKNTNLPASYTPFGTITSGLDILQNVAKAGTSCTYSSAGGGVPAKKVVIKSVTINKS